MYFGVFFSTFILIFKKEAFDIGISKIGLNVTILEVGIGLILMALQNDIFTSEAIHTKKFCVMPNIVSDHAPLYIQFEITDSEQPIPHIPLPPAFCYYGSKNQLKRCNND